MKKKIAVLSALVMAVVVTGYSVSGTYAKYISEIDISDEARVAKWEIGLNNKSMYEMNLFEDSYTYGTNGEVIKSNTKAEKCSEVPVDENDLSKGMQTKCEEQDENVVAPGAHGQYSFKLNGDIETNYKITLSADGSVNNVVLPAGTVIPKTGSKYGATSETLTTEYSPLKFYITKNGKVVNAADTDEADGTITDYTQIKAASWMNWTDFKDAVENLYKTADGNNNVYAANVIDNTEYTIYWKWDFTEIPSKPQLDSGEADYDATLANAYNSAVATSRRDTLLGNLIVQEMKKDDYDSKTNENYKVKLKINITAEQTQEAATITDITQLQ